MGEDTRFLDAVSYILEAARTRNRPVVINFSSGSMVGPHDGLTAVEQWLPNGRLLDEKFVAMWEDWAAKHPSTVPVSHM